MASDKHLTNLRAKLKALYEKGVQWREIASLPEFDGVPPGTLCSIAKGNYEPKDNEIRKTLGLPTITIQYRDPITGRFVNK